jgi:hypothetical protein
MNPVDRAEGRNRLSQHSDGTNRAKFLRQVPSALCFAEIVAQQISN